MRPTPNGIGLALCIVLFMLFMTGCTTKPPEVQTRVVEVPSSAPYKFIHYTDKTDDATAKQIRRHNRAHAAVIEAEKKAKASH
jgi:outer membrane PBP1 activator LpoA protein